MKTISIALSLTLGIMSQAYAQDQDLVETYRLALENDPALKRAYYNQLAIGESKSQSIAQMLPSLSVTGTTTRERLNNKKQTFQNSGVQNYSVHGFTVNFSQPIFHWDHWVSLGQSENRIAQVEAEYQAELQNLYVKTTEAYFNVLSAQDNLEFTIAEQTAIERQLDQAKQRFDVGLIAITDVYEAQASFDLARANQIDAENELNDSKEALREIIGENPIELAKLIKPIELVPPSPNNIEDWQKAADSNNFNIIAALNQAEINRKEIDIQQSGHIPTLDAVADYRVQEDNSTFGLRGDTHSYGLRLNIPLFEGGNVSSRTRQAEFNYLSSKEELSRTQRQVKRELRNAFRDVISSLSRIRALKAAVESAESSLEASEAGFEVGTRTMVDVLSEQRNLYEAKRDYARSRYDYLINSIKLKQTTGSLTDNDLALVNKYLTD